MIHLWYSNSLGKLTDAFLATVLRQKEASSDALCLPTTILVPNRNIESYLKFGIAAKTGIAANLRFCFLEELLSSLLRKSGKPLRVVDKKVLQSFLLSIFSEKIQTPGSLPKPVEVYLQSGGLRSEETDLRIFQLSAQLARIFESYIHSRGEMLKAWETGRTFMTTPPFSDIEAWQSDLWRMLFESGGKSEEVSALKTTTFLTYGHAFDTLAAGGLDLPPHLHLFGFSYVSRLFNRIFQTLAVSTELSIYTINPCMEFWEDVQTFPEHFRDRQRFLSREKKRTDREGVAESEDPFGLQEGNDTPALRLWGRPGRENVHLLNEVAEFDFHSVFEDPLERGASLLRQLQHDSLLREPERPDQTMLPTGVDFSGDSSIRILACPGIQREVEIIANEIWALIKDGEVAGPDDGGPGRLRFNDIAVIIADTHEFSAYRTHIAAAFNEIHALPHSISDIAMDSESKVLEALDLLLALPLSRFTREDVLKLLIHPSVLCRYPEVDPGEWIAWCRDLNIVHGIDKDSHKDTYIKKDLYNWDQGIRRLVLGAFMTGRDSGDTRAFTLEGSQERYLPEEYPQGSLGSAAIFTLLVRSLFSDALHAKEAKLSLTGWSEFLMKMAATYIEASSEEDDRVLSRSRSLLFSLREMDLDGREVSYTIAREYASSLLSGIQGSRGQYLTKGVVVSSFLPMRPIPFKVVFIAGMGEGRFPAREVRNPLDLRAARRLAGDVSPRERDQYMFLETLVSTRDRLYLSYVSRDSQTGEELEPSSVISELLFILERGYLSREQLQKIVVNHPLRRFDATYFPDLFPTVSGFLPNYSPAARREANILALRDNLKTYCQGELPGEITKESGKRLPESINKMLGLCRAPSALSSETETSYSMTFYQIKKFLHCPLQGWATFQLGLREDEDENTISCIDERFSMERLHSTPLLKEVFLSGLNSRNPRWDFGSLYEERIAWLELEGNAPTGIFLEAQRKAHQDLLVEWKRQFESLSLPENEEFSIYRFGKAGENVAVDEILPPLSLYLELPGAGGESRKVKVELSGRTEPVNRNVPGSLLLQTGHAADKHFLQGFLDYLILTLAGFEFQNNYHVIMLTAEKAKVLQLGKLDRPTAEQYLKHIITELLFSTHSYLLPVEALFDYWGSKDRDQKRIYDVIINYRDSDNDRSYSSLYGPVPHPEDYEPPDEGRAKKMLENRFGLYFVLGGLS